MGPLRSGGFGSFNALAFDDEGRLFALEYGDLFQVNLKTGAAQRLGSLGGSDGDLAWVGKALVATVNGGGSACHLVRIDMKTWRATDVGRIRYVPAPTTGDAQGAESKGDAKKDRPDRARNFADVWGLIWDGRTLYGVTPEGEVLRIDHRTARARPVMRVSARFYGACALLRV